VKNNKVCGDPVFVLVLDYFVVLRKEVSRRCNWKLPRKLYLTGLNVSELCRRVPIVPIDQGEGNIGITRSGSFPCFFFMIILEDNFLCEV